MKILRLAVICAFTFVACSSGSTTTPGPASSTAQSPASAARRVATSFVIKATKVPQATHRRAQYVGAGTQSVSFQLISVNGTPVTGPGTIANANIALASCPCTVAGPDAQVGTDVFAITTYDGQYTGGVQNGSVISTATSAPTAIALGAANVIDLTLNGVPASFAISGMPSGMVGTSFAATAFNVAAEDVDGNTIVGTYANPVTLANSDVSGATTLATAGTDGPPANELLSSSDSATLAYSGVGIVSATITASAGGATNGTGVFAPPTVAPTLASVSPLEGVAGNTVSETLTGTNFYTGTTVAADGTGVTVTGVNVTSATSLTANFVVDGSAAFGARNVTITTPGGTSGAQALMVATGSNAVTTNADSGTGSLRAAITAANPSPGEAITFNCGSPCTIALQSALPAITANMIVDGGTFGTVVIDGQNTYRGFFVDTGSVLLGNLQLQNMIAQGGLGGGTAGSGGGGAGLGAGLFVNQAGAVVAVTNVYFLNLVASGTHGGVPNAGKHDGGGGGGLGASGGVGVNGSGGGGGGGGMLGSGASGTNNGGAGGNGGGGGGGALWSSGSGGAGGAYYASATNGAGGNGGNGNFPIGGRGGNGGFGGGGGGGGSGNGAAAGTGGNGGFGGGGGGEYAGTAGNGGPGGGGGGANSGTPGSGGSLGAGVAGGQGGLSSGAGAGGGGGAAAGPAIFVNAGTVTTNNSGASGTSSVGGLASTGATRGTADSTPVFNYTGTVNGSATTGPIASALSGSTPQSFRRRRGP